ncbi:hypothetical protein [Gemmata sp.]|uniref:hypothetical protein n=1 Tax=Gemmata sp. TaxID=1914242 RepID=UPI003F7055E9
MGTAVTTWYAVLSRTEPGTPARDVFRISMKRPDVLDRETWLIEIPGQVTYHTELHRAEVEAYSYVKARLTRLFPPRDGG